MTEGAALEFELHGQCRVSAGTSPLAGVRNQFVLPTGQLISIYAVIEMSSTVGSNDHRNLDYHEATALGLTLDVQERAIDLADADDIA